MDAMAEKDAVAAEEQAGGRAMAPERQTTKAFRRWTAFFPPRSWTRTR